MKKQAGQTLIETLVGLFILVMGISAAVGLAIYAFSTSTTITESIIGNGLAREGIEAVKSMRDTNWLKLTLSDPSNNPPGCYSYKDGFNNASCYKQWLNPPGSNLNTNDKGYDLSNGGTNATSTYILGIDPNPNNKYWQLTPENSNFDLDFDQNVGNLNFKEYYIPHGSNGSLPLSGFHRKIILSYNSSAPYNTNVGPELQVTAQVWWTDKKCPASPNWPGLGNCSVALTTYLTNWKNY